VYLPGSSATSDYYGGHRPGNNLFAETLICVEAKTGKRVWHFQTTHHGLWDYDLPAQPVLGDVTVNGRRIKAVMQVSKQAFTYVFDRKTGAPVWPIEERPVPQSKVPREQTSPTQPFPIKPPAFDLQGSTENNLIDFTPALRTQALEQLQSFEHGPLFTPPSEKGTLVLPGNVGGANWGGGAFDPETGVLYIPSKMTPALSRVSPGDPKQTNLLYRPGGGAPGEPSPASLMTIEGLSIFKPPYARVTAIDMNKGEHIWMTPLGNGPRNHPLLRDLHLPPLGDFIEPHRRAPHEDPGVRQCPAAGFSGRPAPPAWAQWGDADMDRHLIYVFDKQSGTLLRAIDLDGMSAAPPMTFLHGGNQYIVAATGAGENSELVALSVP
jgi:quinoprotein glucose dehydrogenase